MTDVLHHPDPVSLLARPYRALTVGTVALVSLIGFEYLAVATAMPAAAQALNGLALYALAFGGALAAGVVSMVVAGDWADAKGPAAPLWAGGALFATGLVIAGLAPTMETLVLGRIVQGFGAGLLSVSLYVVVGRVYPVELRPRIFAAFAAAWIVPSIVGPAIAGLIVEHVGWRWVFLAVPFFALPAALLVRPGLGRLGRPAPDAGPTTARPSGRVAWAVGAALSAGLLHYGGQEEGPGAPFLLGLALVGIVLFVPRLLPAGAFRARRGLPTVVALRGIAAAAFLATEVYVPLLLSRERGLSPAAAGLALTVGALAWSAGSWYQGRPNLPLSRARLLQIGMALIAAGVATVALTVLPTVPIPVGIVGWGAAGLGMGVVYPTLSVLTLELSPPAEQGVNSSALQLSDSLFSTMGLALGGTLFAALVPYSAPAAYLASFATAGGLALLGLSVASRVNLAAGRPRAAAHGDGEGADIRG